MKSYRYNLVLEGSPNHLSLINEFILSPMTTLSHTHTHTHKHPIPIGECQKPRYLDDSAPGSKNRSSKKGWG